MSTTLYKEAIAEVQQLKQLAEQNAKNKIIEALTPRIQAMVESQLLSEQEEIELVDVVDGMLPAPEEVEVEDVEGVRSVRIPGNDNQAKLILTGDQNLVDLSYIVRWNIKDLSDFKFRVVDPVDTVNEAAEAAMRAAVAETELDETFSGQGRAAIELDVRERMQRTLDGYRAGVNVLGVEIEKADPPAQVVDAFRDVQVAEQNADAARNQARSYAQQVLAQAQGEAEAFDKVYQQYRLAPQVTRQRLYYETMERVLSQTDKTIVETGNVTPYLPLPEIRRRAQQSSPATVVTAPEGQ